MVLKYFSFQVFWGVQYGLDSPDMFLTSDLMYEAHILKLQSVILKNNLEKE